MTETTATTHQIPTIAHRWTTEGPEAAEQFKGYFEGDNVILKVSGIGNYARDCKVGGWDATGSGRHDHGGPIVTGAHAYIFELGVMIAATPIVRRETVIPVTVGDLLELPGGTYRIVAVNRVPELEPVTN